MTNNPLKALIPIVIAVALVGLTPAVRASGPVGFYGIVEKVVLEPAEDAPVRAQIWGVFAYVDGGPASAGVVSAAKRGYLYYSLPPDSRQAEGAKREWRDLKSVAGTGQVVGFGAWGYMGSFQSLDPAKPEQVPANIRVRSTAEPLSTPAVYFTNVGVVKIPAEGSRADVVRRLQELLPKP